MYRHPEINGLYVPLSIPLRTCPCCQSRMLDLSPYVLKLLAQAEDQRGSYFKEKDNRISAQLERAGVVPSSDVLDTNDQPVCEACVKAGRVTFICFGCKRENPVNLIHFTQPGDPCESVCIPCYESHTAKVWDQIIKDLAEKHRWDFA